MSVIQTGAAAWVAGLCHLLVKVCVAEKWLFWQTKGLRQFVLKTLSTFSALVFAAVNNQMSSHERPTMVMFLTLILHGHQFSSECDKWFIERHGLSSRGYSVISLLHPLVPVFISNELSIVVSPSLEHSVTSLISASVFTTTELPPVDN